MNNRDSNFFRFSFALFDLVLLNLVHFTTLYFLKEVKYSEEYFVYMATSNLSWILATYFTGLYIGKQHRFERFFIKTTNAFLVFFVLLLIFVVFYHYSYSRLFIFLSIISFFAVLAISRVFSFISFYYLEKKTAIETRVVFIGYTSLTQELMDDWKLNDSNIKVVGFFDDTFDIWEKNPISIKYLGRLQDCLQYIHSSNNVSEIYSTISPESNSLVYEIAEKADMNFIRMKFVPDFRIFINRRVHVDFTKDIPILSLRPEPMHDFRSKLKKRVFDLIFSSFVVFFILSWLVPLIAILIKLESKGPVFFKQQRSGKNNRSFVCYKFRSLRMNDEADVKQVTRNDDRFTRIGKFLRKSNLDEMPQFFNVFWGEMSVVGPRPHMLRHTEEYSNLVSPYMLRHFVKPGVTGWAQVHGFRGEINEVTQLQNRISHDIWYIENWSFWLDLRIIMLTIITTIKGGDRNAI